MNFVLPGETPDETAVGDRLPFHPATEIERQILSEPEFLAGMNFGEPRPGHPEGAVKWHIADVLGNVEKWYGGTEFYLPLRLIPIIHDSFKSQVDQSQPKTGPNHHGMYARRFAERHFDDQAVLEVTELHDEAYNSWVKGMRSNKWEQAEERARKLIERLGSNLGLYLAFYRCDNATGDKESTPFEWFTTFASRAN